MAAHAGKMPALLACVARAGKMPALPVLLLSVLLIVSCRSTDALKPSDAGESPGLTFKVAQSDSALPVSSSRIKVFYPKPTDTIQAASTFLVGSAPPGVNLVCNSQPVKVNSHGYFAHVVPIKPGANKFVLAEAGGSGQPLEVSVLREVPPPALEAGVPAINQDSAQPRVDKGVTAGDIIEFSVQATPDAYVEVQLDKRKIPLRALSGEVKSRKRKRPVKAKKRANPRVNAGLDTAFGRTYQRKSAGSSDHYTGFYKIAADDNFQEASPKFAVFIGGKSKSWTSPIKITVVGQPTLAQTKHDDTVVRLGPGQARTTPLVEGIRLLVDGWHGNEMRCCYAPNKHVWIQRDDLSFETYQGESGPTPYAAARTVNIGLDAYGDTISIPLTQRLAYQVEQSVRPNRIVFRLFGVTADTDWITPSLSNSGKTMVDNVTWKQVQDGVYELVVTLKADRQWGFKVDYSDTTAVLHIKRPPALTSESLPLKGLTICIDPGHGGSEPGCTGCGGVKEKDINLGIGLKIKPLLEQAGANVVMTRQTDTDVTLQRRVEIAQEHSADILISVHNNALPDGQDPWTERGTSTYWYHPQSIELAQLLKKSVVQSVGLPDFGTRYQNLFLCRPSLMPAVLVEVGFLIHPDEYVILVDDAGQQKAALGIVKGLTSYFHSPAKEK